MRRLALIAMFLLCWLVPAAGAAAQDEAGDNDRIVVVGPVLVDADETVGDVFVLDGDVVVRGTVTGDLVAIKGDVTIRGTVAGDVLTVSGLATLGRRGRIAGDLVYGDDAPVRTPGSRVGGEISKFSLGDVRVIAAIGAWIAMTVSLLVLGLLLLALAPKAGAAVARTGRAKALPAAGVGVLGLILIPVIAVIAIVTLIGLPLGIVLGLLIVPLLAFSYLATALVLGRLLLKKSTVLAFVVGLVLLQALVLIPIAGGLIWLLAVIFGLGVLLLTLLRARS